MSVENAGLLFRGTVRTVARSTATHTPEESLTREDQLAEMIVKAADGDQAAFAALYDATSNIVFGMARSVFPNQSGAETAAHDVYVAAWMSASTFDPRRHRATAWLQALARRNFALVLASELRRTWREEEYGDDSRVTSRCQRG